MAKRVWDKGQALDAEVHRFTVGDDPQLDGALVRFDAIASAAHARMLHKIKVLSADESTALLKGLAEALKDADRGKFVITPELEDAHTALEAFLTERAGEAGKKIHTGRSRNDQVMAAMRLFMRSHAVEFSQELSALLSVLFQRFDEIGATPLPGYTHMQLAMPSSVGMWLQAWIESTLDLSYDGMRLLDTLDANPLGVGSGFGVPLPLDRAYVAELLSLTRVQRGPVAVQNSRGQFELRFVRWLGDITAMIEKAAWDLLLFSTEEFGFFKIPVEFTTGSSIMPQKQNPDVLELLRAQASRVRGAARELEGVIEKLPSNYHRDFQLTKRPLMEAIAYAQSALKVFTRVVASFQPVTERIQAAMKQPALWVTYAAYAEAAAGKPFREAYKAVAADFSSGKFKAEKYQTGFAPIEKQIAAEVQEAQIESRALNEEIAEWQARLTTVEESIFSAPL